MRRANYGSEPEFDEDIIEEYRRASAESFTAPKSKSLRQPPKEEPFRWPGLDQRRDTVALDRDELAKVVNDDSQALADTVLAKGTKAKEKPASGKWVLDIDGVSLYLLPGADVVVGRKPQSVEGAATMTVNDPGRTLSKSHARIFFENGSWHVQDLGSTNGTAIHIADENGFTEDRLRPGEIKQISDNFRLGTLKVRLRKLIG